MRVGPTQLAMHGIAKIKLSEIREPQVAINKIAEKINEVHQLNKLSTAEISGNDAEILWNALLYFYDGHPITLIEKTPLLPNVDFIPPKESVKALLDSLFEFDIPEDQWINVFGQDHPLWILYQALNDEQNAQAELTRLFHDVLTAIAMKNPNVQLVSRHTPFSKNNNVTQIEKEASGKVSFVDPSPRSPSPITTAKKMHERMIGAATYLDAYDKILKDFVDQPNTEANQLFARIQAKRQSVRVQNGHRPKVCVVGLGPGGASTAIHAYLEGADVVCVEKRNNYTRNNTFRFIPAEMNKFLKLFMDDPETQFPTLPDTHPLKQMFSMMLMGQKGSSPAWGQGWHEFTPITIRDFEYFVNMWINLVAKRDPNGMKIYRGYSYVPGSVNREKGAVYIRELENGADLQIPVDCLIGADGYQSQCRQDCGIQPLKMSTIANYGTYNYHPERADASQRHQSTLVPFSMKKDLDITELKKLGWEHDRQPVPRFFNTGNHPYLGIEIPDFIVKEYRRLSQAMNNAQRMGQFDLFRQLKEQRYDLMDAWGKATMEAHLPKNVVDNLVLKDCAVIDVQLQKAEKATHITGTGIIVALIGDADLSAHFQTGSGAIMAWRAGESVGEMIKALIAGKMQSEALQDFEQSSQERALALHTWAFDFPSGEELNTKPTQAFHDFRAQTRLAVLKRDFTGEQPEHTSLNMRIQAENSTEAQAKTETKLRRTGRK